MPTEDRNLALVLKALMSVGDVTLEETESWGAGRALKCYRMSITSSVIIDRQHAQAIKDYGIVPVEMSDQVETVAEIA